MYTKPVKLAFDAKLTEFAAANSLEVCWRDRRKHVPVAIQWVAPSLAPDITIPGPVNRGVLMGTLRGNYIVECFSQISDGQEAAFDLADRIAIHFFPLENSSQGLETDADINIRVRLPSVIQAGLRDGSWHRATVLVPYLVYAQSA